MPQYEYECKDKKCKTRKDVVHKMGEKPELTCEKCGKPMRRVYGIAGFSGLPTPKHYR